ncbi:MAG: ParB/RepB/Spo0J family partition protein [Oscillospiraceae bacterium]|nr:ParB/RepB/Spo0J family partition protein [Oscillospiraceae bacterium]
MAAKKGGLGRGLDSLFIDSGGSVAAPSVIKMSEIEPDKEQPRKIFEDESLAELAASIEEHGVLQPIAVRPLPAGGYRIIAGERRWRAARLAGLKEIPAVVKDVSDSEAMELALIENLQREDLDPVEEAEGYRQLMDRCGLTQEEAAKRLGKSRAAVANSLRLLGLPLKAREWLREGKLSFGHAKVILGLESEELRLEAARTVIEKELNVRETETLCKKLKKPIPAPKTKMPEPALPAEVALALKEALGTEVKLQYKEGKGALTVHFYSDAQLRAFANLLGQYDKENGAHA